MLRQTIRLILAVICLLYTSASYAQLPQISNGLGYLSSSQNPDGTWQNGTTQVETTAATFTVLKTLKLLNQTAGTTYTTGAAWLQAQTPQSVEYIAERLYALTLADTGALTQSADATGGGWGGDAGYATNLLDTASALQSLNIANYTDTTIINSALTLLTTSQNTDGGWGFYKGDDSNVYMTAVVSATLQQFPQMSPIATAVGKASVFLLAHQNPDGGFGSSPSTVFETAMAYAALAAVFNDTAVLGNAVTYLTTTQTANGSWDDDPYATALALKALYLSENIPSPPPPPPAAGTFTGTVVDAITGQRVAGVAVVLDSNNLVNTVTDSTGGFTLKDVPPGSQKVSFTLSGYAATSASATSTANVATSLGNVAMVSAFSTGTIAGTISDDAGKPLAGVAIAVTGAWRGGDTTGADGSYSITYVSPGAVTITASKSGYQDVTASGTVYARTTLSFSPRLSTSSSTVTTGMLVGRVVSSWGDLPIDHLPGEEGVTVKLSGGIIAYPDADNGGRFSIPDLPPNTYQVIVGMNGFTTRTFRALILPGVTIDLGMIRLEMNISTMALTGKITDATTGAPIPGAEVTIVDNNLTGRADFAGTYAITDIPTGVQYTVKVSAAGYVGKTYTISSSPWTQTMNIALVPKATKGSLTGTVVDADNNQPLAGVTVTLVSDPTVSVTTDAGGSFTFAAVPKGVQQLTLALDGYAGRTLTTAISAGTVNNVRSIPLSVNPLNASIRGRVWDGYANAPFAGVEIVANRGATLQTFTGGDGTYALDNVEPGTVTLTATATTKTGYYSASFTGTLEPNGILVFSPTMTTAPPSVVDVTVQTDKTSYPKSDPINIAVTLWNTESSDYATSLRLSVVDPAGAVVYDTTSEMSLIADGTLVQNFVFTLPLSASGGTYKVLADLYDTNGMLLGTGTKSFGVATSQIKVTPVIPMALTSGDNTLSFNLTNTGAIPVSNGILAVSLKDPDGHVVATSTQSFTLGNGQNTSLTYTVLIPALKFGNYTLTYVENDETAAGTGTDLSLPSNLAIAPLFDSNSHRIRQTAGLSVTLTNPGRFNLDPTGAGLPVTVSIPDAGYEETKLLIPVPNIGSTSGSTLLFRFVLPETLTAGLHKGTVTVTLPSGSVQSQQISLAIQESSLALVPIQTSYMAGGTITPQIVNNGGVDTPVQFHLSLYDAKSALIAETSGTGTTVAGASLALNMIIPTGAVDGQYNMIVQFKDGKTAKEETIPNPIVITGVKGTLQVQTDKQSYLSTEIITSQSNISNNGLAFVGGSLHLQVTTAGGNQNVKTWTTTYDFQQGIRSNIDSFETPDAVTLMPVSDNFNDGVFNSDRWSSSRSSSLLDYPPTEQNETLQLYLPSNPPRNWISNNLESKFRITGDFDATVDYNITSPWNSGGNNHASGFYVFTDNWNARIDVWGSSPTYGIIDSYNSYTNVGGARTNGKFRLRRVGSTYYTYFWNGSSWTNAYNFGSRPSGPAGFSLLCFGQGGSVTVLYDNFTILTHTYPASGTINLKYDSGRSATWDKISYTADTPPGTSIKFRTRTADTEGGLSTATWSSDITESGSFIASPSGRWIEVETTLATTNTSTTPTLRDLTVTQGHNAGEVLWQTDIPVSIAQGTVPDLNNAIGLLGVTGKFYLQGALGSSTGQTVATAEYPFYVEQGSIQLSFAIDKKTYKPGDTVTFTGEVKNLSSVDAAGLTLLLKGAGAASQPLFTETFDLSVNGTHPFSFTAVAGTDGTYGLNGTVTQNGTVLAEIDDQYKVTSPVVTATLSGPDTAGGAPFTLNLSIANNGLTDASLLIGNSFGVPPETIVVPAGETTFRQYQQQISADTIYTVILTGDLVQTLTKSVVYVAPTSGNISLNIASKVVVDKVSYNPNERVAIASTLNNQSGGVTASNLTALITVVNVQGQVLFSNATPIQTLNQNQTMTLNSYWNTGGNPAGSYLVSLQVLASDGTVVATASQELVIASSTSPIKLLKGQISLDKQSILTGEPVPVSYSIMNAGNLDLADIAISVQIINLAEQTVYNTITDQATLTMGASHANSNQIDTQGYSAKDYLVVLRASIAGVEETLAGTYFRVEGAPSAPALVGPTAGADVETLTPVLTVSNAADPNDDKLSYEFELYGDSGLTTIDATGAVPETAGVTGWVVPTALVENQTYYWRGRAFDGKLYSPWMVPASFRVNTINDPPSAPTITSPANATFVATLNPVLTVNNATDPDSTDLTYNFDLALDSDFTQIVATTKGVSAGTGTTAWTVPVNLQENSWYYWRVQADDWLATGTWSTTARFFVNTSNGAPSAPVITSPGDGSTVAALSTDLVVTNSTDPALSTLIYFFEVDTVPTFDSPGIFRFGSVSEGQGTTGCQVNGLQDNTRYYVRVKSSNGSADSPWSSVITFVVNTVNDPPTVPILANPSNGAGVNVFSPNLSVYDATDLDHDALTYEFELYADAGLTNLVATSDRITEVPTLTSWTVPVTLMENQTYYWRARAFDGALYSGWMPAASFMVNTANDAPGAPSILTPANSSTVPTLTPTLTVSKAVDPDSDSLTYGFELYAGTMLIASVGNIPDGTSGSIVWTPGSLSDNTVYQWRVRAFDGDRYGAWTSMATFTVHIPTASVTVDMDFEPRTLNKTDKGNWVKVEFELPHGYKASDVDIFSIRLEGTVPAERSPVEIKTKTYDNGCDAEHDKHDHEKLMVKFDRSEVIKVLPCGDQVPVHVIGKVGTSALEGVDVIRVINQGQ